MARLTLTQDTGTLKAYGMVAAAAFLWGSLGVVAKTLYSLGVTPWSLVFFRGALGFLACGLAMMSMDRSLFRVRRHDLPFLALYGLVSTSMFYALYMYTISVTAVAVSVVLLYTAPVFAALMARFAFGEPLTPAKLAALILSFMGCVLVAGLQSEQPAVGWVGIVTGIGSAITYATFGIFGKHARQRYSSWTVLFYSMGFAALFLIPLLALPRTSLGPYPWEVWGWLLFVAAGPTLLARVLYVSAVKYVEASRAAIVANVEPVTAAVFAFVLLGEMLTSSQVLGGVLVLAGAVIAQMPSRRS